MKKFDVIVVGAGSGGCITAKSIAKAGFEVCLIDRKRKEDIGNKVCGDAISKHYFDNLGLGYPAGEELERRKVGAKLFSPDLKTVFYLKGEGLHGFIVNRHSFGQRLLREAMDAGATLLESTQALEPVINNNVVAGALLRDLKRGSKAGMRSQVLVDASGFSAALRKKLPPEIGIDADISQRDTAISYREIRELKEQVADPEYIEMYFNQAVTSGGYYWIFPEGGTKVNVGLVRAVSNRFPNPKNQLYTHVLSRPLFKESFIVSGGGAYIPTRRPLDCMVGDGIAVVGDAACQTDPVSGAGIGISMTGGVLAAKTIIEALERVDVSRAGLWPYNVKYMRLFGAEQASHDVFRMFLRRLTDDDLNCAMKYRLITENDLIKTDTNEDTRLNIIEMTLRIFRGLRRPSFVKRLMTVANLMKKVKSWYQNYPISPKGFEEWKKKAHDLIEKKVNDTA